MEVRATQHHHPSASIAGSKAVEDFVKVSGVICQASVIATISTLVVFIIIDTLSNLLQSEATFERK